MRFALLSILFGLLLSALPSSRAQGLQQGTQIWGLSTLRGPLNEKGVWEYYLEIQPRVDLQSMEHSRILIRPALIYNLDTEQSLSVGALDLTDPLLASRETRTWQQYQRIDRTDGLILLNRTRLEERFAKGESDIGLRVRHMLRTLLPIGDRRKWSVVLFDEVFLGLNENKSQPVRGFDQNRFFAGFRVELEHMTGVEFGYLNQYLGSHMNHVPFISVGKVIRPKRAHRRFFHQY